LYSIEFGVNLLIEQKILTAVNDFCIGFNKAQKKCKLRFVQEKDRTDGLFFPVNYKKTSIGFIEVFNRAKEFDNQLEDLIKTSVKKLNLALEGKLKKAENNLLTEYSVDYKEIFEITETPALLFNSNYEIIYFNNKLAELFKIEEQNFKEKLFLSEFFGSNFEFDKFKNEFSESDNVLLKNILLKNNKGKTFLAEIHSQKLKNLRVSPFNLYLLNIYDINSKKYSNKNLDREEKYFKEIVDKSYSGIFIAQNFRFKYLNRKFANIFGYTVDELQNEFVHKLLNKEGRKILRDGFEELKNGNNVEGSYKLVGIKKNSDEIIIDVYVRVYRKNSNVSITGVVNEITEEYEYLKRLEASEEKFRTLTEKAPVGIMIYQGTDVLFVNNEIIKLSGYSKEEILKMKFWELVHPLDREMIKERGMKRQLGANVPTRYSFRILTKQGQTKWVDFTGLLINYEGKPAGIVIVIDITKSMLNKFRMQYSNLLLRTIDKLHSIAAETEDLEKFFTNACDMLVGENAFEFVILTVYEDQEEEKTNKAIYYDFNLRNKYSKTFFSEEFFREIYKSAKSSITSVKMRSDEFPFSKMKLKKEGNWFVLTKSIMHRDKRLGFLTVGISEEFQDDSQIQMIFEELCSKLSLIIFNKKIANEKKQIIQTLQASDERYSNFMNEVSEGIFLLEMTQPIDISLPIETQVNLIMERGIIAECNQAFANMYGAKYPHELFGKSIFDFNVDTRRVKETNRKFINNVYRLENHISIEKDFSGRKKIFNNRLIGVVENGFLKRIWFTQRDITEKEIIQSAIKQIVAPSEGFLGEEYFNSITERLKKLLNVKSVLLAKFLGQNQIKILSFNSDEVELDFDSVELSKTHIEEIIKSQRFTFIENLNIKFKNDKFVKKINTTNAIGVVLKSESDTLLAILILYLNEFSFSREVYESVINLASVRIVKEIEREIYERQLIDSRNDLATILDSTLQAFILIQPDYKIKAFNKLAYKLSEKYFGKKLKYGSKINKYLFEKNAKEFKENFFKALYGEIISKEISVNLENRQEWLKINYEPAIDIEGNTVGVIYSFTEITQQKQIQLQLEIENKRNELLFKNNLDGIYLIDERGDIVDVNEAFRKIVGYSREELIGMNERNLLANNKINEHFNEEFLVDRKFFESQFVTNNGEVIDVEISQTPIELNNRKIIFRSVRNVTERNKNIRKINQLSRAVENSPVSIIITDVKGIIQYVNPAFENMTGYKIDEVIGKKTNILKSNKNDPGIYKELWGKIISGDNFYGELINKKKNGELIWNSISISPIFDEKGKIRNFIGIQEDITEKKRILEELENHKINLEELVKERTAQLHESEERFRRLSENSYDAILRFDSRLNLHYFNPTAQKIFKIDSRNKLPQNFNEISDNDISKEFWREKIDVVISLGVVQRSELKINDQWIDWLFLPEFSSEGKVENVLAFGRDITERKEYEKKIEESLAKEKELNKLKANFLSMASHEFRTPLTAIQTTTDLLEMYGRSWEEDKYREQINKINKNINAMIELLEEIFTLSKSEVGATKVEPVQLNLENFLEEILDVVKTNPNFNHDVVKEFNFRQKTIYTDPKLLKQILLNLLINAIKYTPAGKLIIFKVHDENSEITFSVEDSGVGIPDDEKERIFDPFYRGKNAAGKQGTGLGLAIVKNSALLLKGKISVKSFESKGTSFILQIPQKLEI